MKQPIAVIVIASILFLFHLFSIGMAIIWKKKRPPKALHAFKLGWVFWAFSFVAYVVLAIVYFFVSTDGPSVPFWIGVAAMTLPMNCCSLSFSSRFVAIENETMVVRKTLFRVIRIDLAKPGVQVFGARNPDVNYLLANEAGYMTIWITDSDGKQIRINSKRYDERSDFVGFLQECQEIQKRSQSHE